MNDHLSGSTGRYLGQITLHDGESVRYWTETLGVGEEQLRELMREYGDSPEKIRQVLNKAA
jgi:hypothetical protein